jgi:hypothetical protein
MVMPGGLILYYFTLLLSPHLGSVPHASLSAVPQPKLPGAHLALLLTASYPMSELDLHIGLTREL